MKTTQSNMLASLRSVQAFLKTNADTLASVVTTGTKQELDDAIVTLGGHASNQSQTLIEAKSTTQTQEALRTELLQFHMAPINRIAKLKLSTVPELASFLMPRSKLPIQTLKGFADGMAAAAAKYSATFIAAGLPTDFIAQLNAVSTSMVNANTARDETAKRRQGVTQNLKSMLTMGRKVVHALDPLVRKVIHTNPGLLKNWIAAKRVPRTGSPATPATPATPAAAQPSHTPTT